MRHMRSRRILAMLLALSMIFGLLTTTALADNGVDQNPSNVEESAANSTPAGGSGEGQPSGASEDESSEETNKEDVLPEEETTPEEKKTTSSEEVDTQEGEGENAVALSDYITVNNDETQYATLEAAIAAAEPENGVITYTVHGSVHVETDGWIEIVKSGLNNITKVEFVGSGENAEISTDAKHSILNEQTYGVDVIFDNLTLSHPNGEWVGNTGHGAVYFTTWVHDSSKTVTYTNCKFPNGACNNQYGKTVYDNCKFTNGTSGLYNLWNYGGNTEIKGSTFTGVRGIKTYNEGTLNVAPTVKIESTTFDGLTEKAAVVASKATDITFDCVTTTDCTKGTFQKDIEGSSDEEKVTITANGTGISGSFNVTAEKNVEAAKSEFNISAGSFTGLSAAETETLKGYLAPNTEISADGTVSSGATPATGVATIGSNTYPTLKEAFEAANNNDSIIINAGIYEMSDLSYLSGKTVTVSAQTDAEVTFDNAGAVNLGSANVTFQNIIFDYMPNQNYTGLQHAGDLTYEGCTFNGMVFLYGNSETFNTCTFNQTSADAYNVWTYGAKNVAFNSCTFNCVGKSVLVYNEGTNEKTDLNVNDTKFNASAPVEGKAAIEIDTSLMKEGATITIDEKTTANGFSEGSNSKDSLWNDKKQTADTNKNTTVTVANKAVFVPKSTGVAKGTEANPYALEEFGQMTRDAYIAAQTALNGTMYVTVGNYSYDKNGVLGNGERDDTPGQIPDHSKLNAYGENGYLGTNNDGANGKNIIFVDGTITSGVTGYETIDGITKITSLLLAVPAYTNVTFKGITFNNVMCFNYQLYTSPWSQLGELKFDGCTFNGIIIGSIAAQTLTFNSCTFENFENTTKANNSNPTWIRPAYGNWTEGDNEGQGSDFRSLTTINFTNNTVTSTRPVKFEYISQWNNTTTLTATGNSFDISAQEGDTETKNVGLYIGPHKDKNAVNLVLDNNTKTGDTAALYVIPSGMSKLPVGSTVKNSSGTEIEIPDALEWKTDTKVTLKTEPVPTVKNVAKVGETEYATLEEAIANAEAGQTVTLIADVIQNSQLSIDKSLTLDLAGYKISNTEDIWGDNTNSILSIKNSAVVTITGDGTVDAKENDCYAFNVVNGELTIENGTFYGNVSVVQVQDGTLTVNGGTFDLHQKWEGTNKYLINCIDDAFVADKANVAIYGGTFVDFDPNVSPEQKVDGVTPSFAAPGVGIEKNADGTFTAKTGMVAQVLDATGNSVKAYTSLADAIAAAEAGQTVRLLANATEDVTINKNITLDLGGKTLTNTNAGKATISVTGGTVTVKNGFVVGGTGYYNIEVTKGSNANLSLEDVTATAGNTGSSMIDNWGTLTIESGTYTGGLNVVKSEEGSKLTINGGKFTLDYATSGYTGVIFAYGDTTITGGEFIQSLTTTGSWNHPQVIATGVVEGYTAITRVTGGTFTNKLSREGIFRGVGKATSDNFEVSGGTFNKSISDGFCANGFIPTKNADGTYGVKEGKYVAKIGSTGYETLAAAIAKATNKTKPVTLVADVTESIEIAESKTCKIDLNGFTLTNTEGSHTIVNNGTLTIKDSSAAKSGTVDNVTNARAAIVNYGTMTLAGGTYTRSKEDPDNNKDSGGKNSFYTILNDKGGSLTIEDGVMVTNVGHFSSMIRNGGDAEAQKESILIIKGGNFSGGINTVKNDEFGKLTISGGSFSNTTQCVVMNWNEASITGGTFELARDVNSTLLFSVSYNERANGKMTISGGTFKYTETQGLVQDTYNNGEFTGTLAVSGGTFAHAVEPKYCAEGFEPVITPNYDGFYEVKAVEGDAELLNADGSRVKYGYANQLATDTDAQGKTIKLFKDTTNGGFMLPAGVTLDLNGKTMTSSFLFATGDVIDSADGTGKLVVAKELVQFQKNDTYLPLYNKAENAYQFFKYSFLTYSANLVPNTNNDKLQIVMQLIFENKAAYDILVQDPDGIHGIKLGFSLSWGDLVSISQTWEIRMPSEQIPPIYKGQANPAKRGIALTIIGLNQLPTSVTTFNTEAVLAAGCWPNSISVSGGLKTTTLN